MPPFDFLILRSCVLLIILGGAIVASDLIHTSGTRAPLILIMMAVAFAVVGLTLCESSATRYWDRLRSKFGVRETAFSAVLGLLLLLWLFWQRILPHSFVGGNPLSIDLDKRGQFGDSYGSLTSLFACLGFLGVATTIYFQFLDKQRQEKERNEDIAFREIQRTEELEDRYKRDKDQKTERFEARFFRLSDVLRAHVQSTEIDGHTGKLAFDHVTTQFKRRLEGDDPTMRSALEEYKSIYSFDQNQFGPYFRLLYRIIKYADESGIDDKVGYTGIVRAEMGSAELWLLAFNCLTPRGNKFRRLVIKYHLLKHLSKSGTQWDSVYSAIKRRYPRAAFDDGIIASETDLSS